MIGQAEHDVNAQCILVTKDNNLANQVLGKIFNINRNIPRKNISFKSLKKNGLIILVKSDKQIIDVINEIIIFLLFL